MKRTLHTNGTHILPGAIRLLWLACLLCVTMLDISQAQSPNPQEQSMQHYIMIFRASRTLPPDEQQRRRVDLRHWIKHVNESGISLDPRNLGELAVRFTSEGGSIVSHKGPLDPTIVTMVFFDAPGKDQALEVARSHPGPH